MATTMLWGMLLMALAFWMYSIAMSLYRVRAIILERRNTTPAGWPSFRRCNDELGQRQRILCDGGYGLYVWGSFGVTAAALLVEALLARKRLADTRRLLRRELRRPRLSPSTPAAALTRAAPPITQDHP